MGIQHMNQTMAKLSPIGEIPGETVGIPVVEDVVDAKIPSSEELDDIQFAPMLRGAGILNDAPLTEAKRVMPQVQQVVDSYNENATRYYIKPAIRNFGRIDQNVRTPVTPFEERDERQLIELGFGETGATPSRRRSLNPAMDAEVPHEETLLCATNSLYRVGDKLRTRIPRGRSLPDWNGSDWPRFLTKARRFARTQNWDDETLKGEILMACEDAIEGSEDIDSDVPLADFLRQMSDNFGDRTPALLRVEFANIHQKLSQTPMRYALELARRGVQAYGQEFSESPAMVRLALDQYIKNLIDPELSRYVWCQNPRTMFEAAKVAAKWQEGRALQGGSTSNVEKAATTVPPLSQSYAQIAAMDAGITEDESAYAETCYVNALREMRSGNRFAPQQVPQGAVAPQPKQWETLVTQPQRPKVGYNTCYHCREEGHLRKDCEKLKKLRRTRALVEGQSRAGNPASAQVQQPARGAAPVRPQWSQQGTGGVNQNRNYRTAIVPRFPIQNRNIAPQGAPVQRLAAVETLAVDYTEPPEREYAPQPAVETSPDLTQGEE